jgi:hypothetical protein
VNRTVKLNRIESVLSTLEYPTTPTTVAASCGDVTVELAEGTVNLGETIAGSGATQFGSADDLELELLGLLPRHAVGEPYQSEGDA